VRASWSWPSVLRRWCRIRGRGRIGHFREEDQEPESPWNSSKLDHLIFFQKIVPCDSGISKAEIFKDFVESACVVGRDEDHELDVFGKTRGSMESEGVAADEEELNFPREAQFDKFANVGVKCHRH
jgi:hypothetical protein